MEQQAEQTQKLRQDIRNAALAYLARREHSYKELLTKIGARYSQMADNIVPVLDELVEARLLSDHRFAEAYVRARMVKGFGPERIALELREKGIDSQIAGDCLNNADIDWSEVALKVWSKKFRLPIEQVRLLSYPEKAKHGNFLRYRGFRRDEVEAVLSQG